MKANFSKLFAVFLFFALTFLSTPITTAETGNITISDEKLYSQYNFVQVGGFTSSIIWTSLVWDTANYNSIRNFRISSVSPLTFVNSFESTAFTITSGGSGGGYAWYDRNFSKIYFVFNSGDVFTSSPLTLSYTTNIFLNVSVTNPGNLAHADETVSSTKPIGFNANDGKRFVGYYQDVNVALQQIDQYSVSYLPNGFFKISITKSASINTAYYIHGAVSEYSHETTFNKVSIIDAIFKYADGLYANATLTSGTYSQVLINSSGLTGAGGSGGQIPNNPCPSNTCNYIYADKFNYTVDDFGHVYYNVGSSWFNNIYTYSIEITNPDGSKYIPSNFNNLGGSNNALNGNALFQFSKAGTVTFTLNSYLFVVLGSALSSFSVNVAEPHAYIYGPAKVATNTRFNVTYNYDYNESLAGLYHSIIIQKAGENKIEQYVTTLKPDALQHNISINLFSAGTYTLSLSAGSRGTMASTSVLSVQGVKPPSSNISITKLNLSSNTYFFGDSIRGNYAIDTNNWSAVNSNMLWEIYNADNQIITMYGYVTAQTGDINLLIANNPFFYWWSGVQVKLPSSFIGGNNYFWIVNQTNSGLNTTIANASFYLGATNLNGYGLYPSKSAVENGEPFTLIATIPPSTTAKIDIYNDLHAYVKSINLSSSRNIPLTITLGGTTYFYLYDANNTEQASTQVKVAGPLIPTGTPAPSPQAATMTFVGSAGFIALIFFFAIVAVCAFAGGIAGVVLGILASIPILFIAGLIPLWLVFLDAAIVFLGIAIFAGTQLTKQR